MGSVAIKTVPNKNPPDNKADSGSWLFAPNALNNMEKARPDAATEAMIFQDAVLV